MDGIGRVLLKKSTLNAPKTDREKSHRTKLTRLFRSVPKVAQAIRRIDTAGI